MANKRRAPQFRWAQHSEQRPTALVVMKPCGRRSRLIKPMKEAGIQVLAAPDSLSACHLLARHPPVQAVLIDVELPHEGWHDVADAVAANDIDADILVCARHLSTDLWREALRYKVYDFIFTPEHVERVSEALEHGKPRPLHSEEETAR